MTALLVFSYYSNFPGACQAEWIDDKIRSFNHINYNVDIISSSCCNSTHNSCSRSINVPSISFFDFIDELKLFYKREGYINFSNFIWLPAILVIGLPLDLIIFLLLKGNGEGRWSWSLSATFAGIIHLASIPFKPKIIVSTGGPASAHVAAIISSKIFKLPLVAEFQDPLAGDGIGRNSRSKLFLQILEKFILLGADKVVYVTQKASSDAQVRYPRYSHKITCVYPGAWIFYSKNNDEVEQSMELRSNDGSPCNSNVLRIIHLGSLYSSRNFDLFFSSLDDLEADGCIERGCVKILNLGHVSANIFKSFTSRDYASVQEPVTRRNALRIASNYDALILIQNTDSRSSLTIPYKTYDYLNLNKPILGLLANNELHSLLSRSSSYLADCRSKHEIKDALLRLYLDHIHNNLRIPERYSFDSIPQSIKFLKLD